MSKNKELVAEAIAAIPLWIAFLDKKEAEQDALLAEMQGNKASPKTFIEKMTSRLKPKKEQPDPVNDALIHENRTAQDSSVIPFPNTLPPEELLDSDVIPKKEKLLDSNEPPEEELLDNGVSSFEEELPWAPKTTNENKPIEEEEEEEEEELFQNVFQ